MGFYFRGFNLSSSKTMKAKCSGGPGVKHALPLATSSQNKTLFQNRINFSISSSNRARGSKGFSSLTPSRSFSEISRSGPPLSSIRSQEKNPFCFFSKKAFFSITRASATDSDFSDGREQSTGKADPPTGKSESSSQTINNQNFGATFFRKHRDSVVNAMTKDGQLRIAIVSNSRSVSEVARRQKIQRNPAVLDLFSRCASAASLLSSFLKGDERVIVQIRSDQAPVVQNIIAEAIQVGEIRGILTMDPEPGVPENAPAQNIGDLILPGILIIKRILYDMVPPSPLSLSQIFGYLPAHDLLVMQI